MSQNIDVLSGFQGIVKRYISNVEKMVTRVAKEATSQILKEVEKESKELFKIQIEKFYSESPRRFYESQRRQSLFDLYMFEVTDEDTGGYRTGYDMDAVTPTRKGKGKQYMYDTVFKKGYHGGADDGPLHPAVGVPYYRKYPPKIRYGKPWRYWSRPALKSDSPYDEFEKELDKLYDEKREKLRQLIIDKYNEEIKKIRW